jgi:hypothetical protein
MLADRRYCYPLTITDYASRYLFAVEALQSTKEATAFTVFERVFRENGLPTAIRTGVSGILCARPVSSLTFEAFAEDDGELRPCLEPLAWGPFPVLGGVIENEI